MYMYLLRVSVVVYAFVCVLLHIMYEQSFMIIDGISVNFMKWVGLYTFNSSSNIHVI